MTEQMTKRLVTSLRTRLPLMILGAATFAALCTTEGSGRVHADGGDVMVCDDSQFRGFCQHLVPGRYDWGSIHNDTISSIAVPDGFTVQIFKDTHFQGDSAVFTSPSAWVGDIFNDNISSIVVLGPSPQPSSRQSQWSCFLNGRGTGGVSISWGHTAGAATWACNNWVSQCGNAPQGCTARPSKNEEPGGGGCPLTGSWGLFAEDRVVVLNGASCI
jgi:hypothetical protein